MENGGLYPDWKVPALPKWAMQAPKPLRGLIVSRASLHRNKILQCEADGIEQVAPIVAIAEQNPSELRRTFGKAVWRAIHHSSSATNANRAYLFALGLGREPMSAIVQYRPCHLKQLVKSTITRSGLHLRDAPRFAGQFAAPGQFWDIVRLYEDTVRMGVAVNPSWSLNRLKREHDVAAMEAAAGNHSAEPWAAPYQKEVNGLLFTRLISDRDFAAEGILQRHCVASYRRDAATGRIIVFSISGDARATYAFTRTGHDVDLKGFANSKVPSEVAAAAKTFKAQFLENWK